MKLKGLCNRCGLCCYTGPFRCVNLIVTGTPGQPEATKCGRYNDRYAGLPIIMVDREGKILEGDHVCCHGREDESIIIALKGIGKGCSLEVDENG